MNEKTMGLSYQGSLGWIIFWAIFFFPIAIVLFFTKFSFQTAQNLHQFRYNGSRFWLCFWLPLFFPVAIILFFVNGFRMITIPNG